MKLQLHRGALLGAALVTAAWTAFIIYRPGVGPLGGDGIPFAWRWHSDTGRPQGHYDVLAIDFAIWFVLFYAMIRGFLLMQKSPFRRPFSRRPVPPFRDDRPKKK